MPATVDVRDLFTGTGSFGPNEIAGLIGLLGSDPATHRDLRGAIKELDGQEERSPASSVRLGVGQYLLGRWKDAIQTLKSADGGAVAHYYQARSLLALAMAGDHSPDLLTRATDAFAAAQKGGYDITACAVGVSEAKRLAGHSKEAETSLAKLGPAAESSADFWAQKATIAADLGLPLADTMVALEKALALDPGHPAALFAMGVINDRVGNDDEAKACYERAVQRYPASVGALMNLGILYEDRDDFVNAQQCYKRILQVYPDHPRARLFLKDSSASGNLQLDDQDQKQRDRLDHVLALPVSDFELSVRSRNCLQKMGIATLGDLARTTEAEILESKNFGETSLVEIKEMLATKGLTLGQLATAAATEETVYEPEAPSADDQEVHSLPITDLSLSVRARKCTTKLGIGTIGELIRRTAEDLMECKNFGVTSLNEVREKLTERGLKLRGD